MGTRPARCQLASCQAVICRDSQYVRSTVCHHSGWEALSDLCLNYQADNELSASVNLATAVENRGLGNCCNISKGRRFTTKQPAVKMGSKADVAQLVEQSIRNRQVIGSSPIVGSTNYFRFTSCPPELPSAFGGHCF